ncbi:MAG TPA: hypothetical protein VMZ91_00130 [Candidatus Paceibacterota bacterium]|nr:hypothetical protein [Candidatus Paceibacterota bacterium]
MLDKIYTITFFLFGMWGITFILLMRRIEEVKKLKKILGYKLK